MQRHAGTLPKRYGPGGQRRQTTSRLLQVPSLQGPSSIGGALAAQAQAQAQTAAAAAAAYAIAAAGNANLERTLQPNSMNRNTPVSPDGGNDSPSPTSLVHNPLNGGLSRLNVNQQSVISNGMYSSLLISFF